MLLKLGYRIWTSFFADFNHNWPGDRIGARVRRAIGTTPQRAQNPYCETQISINRPLIGPQSHQSNGQHECILQTSGKGLNVLMRFCSTQD
jgi:hypothetical protein